MGLTLQPIEWKDACEFIRKYHRHHQPPQGWKFGVAVNDGQNIVGVAIIGRPVSRHFDNGWTLEVTRLCVIEGHPNAASKLWAAAWRAAKALGYRRMVSYTLPDEGGASLRAAGWKEVGLAGGGSWNKPSRPRVDKAPTVQKTLWEAA